MLLNREFSLNLKVIMSVLIQLHKFVILQITQDVAIPKAMTGDDSDNTVYVSFNLQSISFVILAREYSMVPWLTLQVAK